VILVTLYLASVDLEASFRVGLLALQTSLLEVFAKGSVVLFSIKAVVQKCCQQCPEEIDGSRLPFLRIRRPCSFQNPTPKGKQKYIKHKMPPWPSSFLSMGDFLAKVFFMAAACTGNTDNNPARPRKAVTIPGLAEVAYVPRVESPPKLKPGPVMSRRQDNRQVMGKMSLLWSN